jgi:hypothetical protein
MRFEIDIDQIADKGLASVIAQLNRWRSRLVQHGHDLQSVPFLDGVWIRDQALAAAANTAVNHKLGRQPRGWLITSVETNYPSVKLISWDSKTATFYAAAASTVDIWFF